MGDTPDLGDEDGQELGSGEELVEVQVGGLEDELVLGELDGLATVLVDGLGGNPRQEGGREQGDVLADRLAEGGVEEEGLGEGVGAGEKLALLVRVPGWEEVQGEDVELCDECGSR